MLIASLVLIALIVLMFTLLFAYVHNIPKRALKFLGLFMLGISLVESILIAWILIYVWHSEASLWGLSFNDFWKEQLTSIYFIKGWLYTWLWNDLLNLLFEFLPAIVFLSIRTVFTTAIGVWFLKISRQPMD